nr:MAG TPA: hypothetical protein [Caudoviricetes sp.]
MNNLVLLKVLKCADKLLLVFFSNRFFHHSLIYAIRQTM